VRHRTSSDPEKSRPLLAPLNFLFTYFNVGRRQAAYLTRTVPGLDNSNENYPVIRNEAKAPLDSGVLQRPPAVDEPEYNTSKRGVGGRTL
jgi:hypothetical protein